MADYQDPFHPAPSDGVTRGDSKSMPNRGTSSGNVPNNSYGADTGVNAINRMGSAHTPSDPPEMCCPPGDGRFTSRGHTSPDPGAALSGTGSDAPDDDTPIDPKGAVMPLDRQKPYATVHGADDGRVFEQHGRFFDSAGNDWPKADSNAEIRKAAQQASELTRTLHVPKK